MPGAVVVGVAVVGDREAEEVGGTEEGAIVGGIMVVGSKVGMDVRFEFALLLLIIILLELLELLEPLELLLFELLEPFALLLLLLFNRRSVEKDSLSQTSIRSSRCSLLELRTALPRPRRAEAMVIQASNTTSSANLG